MAADEYGIPPATLCARLHLEVAQTMRADRAAKTRDRRLGDIGALREFGDARAHREVHVVQHHVRDLAFCGPQTGECAADMGNQVRCGHPVFLKG